MKMFLYGLQRLRWEKKGWTSSHERLKALKMLIVIVIIGFVADAESVTKPKIKKVSKCRSAWSVHDRFCEVQCSLILFSCKLWFIDAKFEIKL